jgi:hypothetical protein
MSKRRPIPALKPTCAAKIGNDKWCENLKTKPKDHWSNNKAVDFAKHGILK